MATVRQHFVERLLAGDTLGSLAETAKLIGLIEGLGFVERLEEEVYGGKR